MRKILYNIFCSLEDGLKSLEDGLNGDKYSEKDKEVAIKDYLDFLIFIRDEIYPKFIIDIDGKKNILVCINNIISNVSKSDIDFDDIGESFRIIKDILKERK